jgi:hypothetical protein
VLSERQVALSRYCSASKATLLFEEYSGVH